ncbi:MAG: hypothetical protein H6927_04655 [Burkholderiaceae bacterium]|jgi:hypothetical protein|nr:hypothetical protein [Pseudomonadota bacterium]MBS0596898.1 hypothetical protein [Pseudomonadota bacterium]MCO5116220.1 DUF6445 family protein [Burkholderiaceae bacterium]MCP5217383.1 hypothetical protein [Burkholderiaceae bacterium]
MSKKPASPARPHFVFAKDGFYGDIARVHRAAQQAQYHELEHATGWRSTGVYHEPDARRKLERLLGVRITRWDTDPAQENGVFYQGFAEGAKAEVPAVHADWPHDDVTIVVYLTPGLPADCGTSLWCHKRTGLTNAPTAGDARRLKLPLAGLRALLERDARRRERWIETDRIGYQCNRMVAYPSGCLHSATRHFGGGNDHGRLYQTFRVGVDWASFRAS